MTKNEISKRSISAQFDALIAQALNSGKGSPLTKADIEKARRIVKKKIAARKSGK